MQRAAGYIVYVVESKGPRFLLLRNARHHTWGFAKGKLDDGEDLRAAARRELREETGIRENDADPDFTAESTYELPPLRGEEPVTKHTTYFLGRVKDRAFERSPEHDAADWMSAEEVVALLGHQDLKRIFRQAVARIRSAGAPR